MLFGPGETMAQSLKQSSEKVIVGLAGGDGELKELVRGCLVGTREFQCDTAHWSRHSEFEALLLVDVSLRRLCGLVQAVRQRGFPLPLLCAGKVNQPDSVALALVIAAGADDYVAVPERLAEMPLRMMALIRHQSRTMMRASLVASVPTPTPIVSARGPGTADHEPAHPVEVLLDIEQRTLSFGGTVVTLTSSEMRILHHLRSRNGEWVAASDLMNQVFGYGSCADSSLIRVHVSSLRKKLGAMAECLESRRTFGYRWLDKAGHCMS